MSMVSFGFSQIDAANGTYQLMTTNVKAREVFTTNILPLIESKRAVNKTVVIKIGDFTWARILSFNAINDANFIPLPEGIIEIDAADSDIQPNTNSTN